MAPAPVRYHEGAWTNPANHRRLFYRQWSPEAVEHTLVLVHGFGEHSGRYETFAQALASHGIATICQDLWGHGRSSGRRGDIDRFEEYLEDLDALTTQIIANHATGKGLAVFGHSFGGLAAAYWALRNPSYLRCLIVQSPLFEVGFQIPAWKLWIADRLTPWWPRLSLPGGVNPLWLSHDRAVVDTYRHDPLVHDRVTLLAYAQIRKAMARIKDDAARLTTPTLFLYAEEDHVVSVEVCRQVAGSLTCERRILGFPNAYHELHHEAVAQQIVLEVAGWVRRHG